MKYFEHTELYHGSNMQVKKPKIIEPDRLMDFGKGFYCTSSQEQAAKWVRSKLKTKKTDSGYVNVYTLDKKKAENLKILKYKTANEEWVDFVEQNRLGIKDHDFDIVVGPVADDDVNRQIIKYEQKEITKDELIASLKTYKLVDQYLFHTEKALECITFKKSIVTKKAIQNTTYIKPKRK